MAYKLPYEQCTKDTKEGKVRRNHGKVLQLALSYGMQANALGIQLGIPLEEAKVLYEAFRDNLHVAFEYGEKVKRFCKTNGYVKTLWGRKRRFPDYMLPPFEIVGDLPKEKKRLLVQRLSKTNRLTRQGEIDRIQSEYQVAIIDNTFKIRNCETQILNSVVQGE